MLGADAVTMSQPVSEGESNPLVKTEPLNPLRNPSYPQRIHIHERAHWQGVLKSCEERIAKAGQKLTAIGAGPNRATVERLYAQMLGARDQVADAAQRLPSETGGLYEEDRHRLEEGVAALERLLKRWESL
ncbi:hypothetical protein SAMN05444166_2055 [Singulisphaera sp. GP187]|uniref:hypothetical protein n=1 Tax=Singulisphaera sp. GP187 TaxID=1882752 RepID=UPI00092AD00F|nr:hypothetical protein [Singulisphaera sp. GP187]SIO01759.1 hypothetical protein SAMN05444166_2055 [Singulisphaera sp. GP187]